jgi:preprotein translocase subunit SecD
MSYEELARTLDRTVESVKEIAENKLGLNIDGKSKILYNAKRDVQNRQYWPQIEKQFTEEEVDLFIYHWGLLFDQFKEDITHTEELQIVELIKLIILNDRILNAQKDMLDNINNIKSLIHDEREKDSPNLVDIVNLERQLAGYYAAQTNLSKENRDTIEEKNTIYKNLKGTRDQRTKNIEESKESIIGWFRLALENRDRRISMGLEMEKMRLAMYKEQERLSKFHTYVDGDIDRPWTTPAILEAANENFSL